MSDRGWNRNSSRGRRGGHGGNGKNWRGGPNKFRDQRDHPYGNSGGFQGGKSNNYQKKPYNRSTMPGKRLAEKDIGVTEYISDHQGFNGIIKSRYSDFQVSEINLNGEVARLTDVSIPEPPSEDSVIEDEDLLLSKYNVEILPLETWDRINKLAVAKETTEKVEIDVTGMTKEQRTRIHDAVKKAFGDAIVGSTVNIDDKKTVCFEKYRKGIRIDNRVKWVWPGEYVHFIVYKENCDTMEAANRIAERLKLNVKPSMLGYAGTKDRRGKTAQWFSLRRIEPKRIANAFKDLREIDVGNFSFSDTHLKLGMLKGNRFRIALRNVTAPEDVVNKACEDLKTKGFINYYGLQRFGTRIEMPTYEIGLKLLQGKLQEAINGILEEREGPLEQALRTYKQTGDATKACNYVGWYGRSNSVEGRLLTALSKDDKDLMQALDKVPRNTRLLYIHSYQSLVWNRCVTERLKRFGLKLAVGDLVLLNRDVLDIVGEEALDDDESDSEENQDGDGGYQDGDGGNKDGDETKPKVIEKGKKSDKKQAKPEIPVKVVTEEDIASNKYTLEDIILPLPGYQIQYPPNMVEYYKELLAKDGLTLQMRHKIKCYSMSGAYRQLAVVPRAVSWSLRRYQLPHADLILSDRDLLRGYCLPKQPDDGKYRALLLEMNLPASCYATMALRELLRVDTSGDTQAAQNNYHNTPDTKEENSVTKDSNIAAADSNIAATDSNIEVADRKQAVNEEIVEADSVGEKRKMVEEEVEAKKVKLEDCE